MVHSYLVIYVMVEAAVYEKIFYHKKDSDVDLTTSDNESERKQDDGNDGNTDVEVVQEYAVYEKMNEMNLDKMGEEVELGAFTMNMSRLSSSGSSGNESSKIFYPTTCVEVTEQRDNTEYEITAKMSYTPPEMRRASAMQLQDEDEDEDEVRGKSDVGSPDIEIPIYRPPLRKSRHLPIPTPTKSTKEVTVYTRVVSMSYDNSAVHDEGSRKTRKSDNPILRQGCTSPNPFPMQRHGYTSPQDCHNLKKATSLDDVHTNHHGKYKSSHTEHLRTTRQMRGGRARSCDGHGRMRSMYYENSVMDHEIFSCSTPSSRDCSRKRRSCCELPGFCHNIKGRRCENEIMDISNSSVKSEHFTTFQTSTRRLYENTCDGSFDEVSHYESVSDQDSYDVRTRSKSRPIDIVTDVKSSLDHQELVYCNGDLDFSRKCSKPYSYSSSSLSVSTRGGSMSSSMSSDFASTSISPPSIINPPRSRFNRLSCWANTQSSNSVSSFQANYLSKIPISRITPESIDQAVNRIASDTNFATSKQISVLFQQETILFVSNITDGDILEEFSIQQIIRYGVKRIAHNSYVAIIAGKPGEEAYCYVVQSDKADDIHARTLQLFQHNVDTRGALTARSRAFTLDVSQTIEPESHCFHYIVKIGSFKVKRSFPLVSDCMKMVLEKVNPKDFKRCNLDINGNEIRVRFDDTMELETHFTPSILSIGFDATDRRYFAFTISENAVQKKTRVICYVYRCKRDITSEKIIEAINGSRKRAISSQFYPTCDLNAVNNNGRSAAGGGRCSSVGAISEPKRYFPPRQWASCPRSISSMSPSSSSFSLSSTTPCPSDTSNSRKSSNTIGWISGTDGSSVGSCEFGVGFISDDDDIGCNREDNELTLTKGNIKSCELASAIRSEDNASPDKLTKTIGYKLTSKLILGKIKQTILTKTLNSSSESRRTSSTLVDSPPISPIPTPLYASKDPPPDPFSVKYICSTVICPPLKEKRVKEIFKQYQKEVKSTKPYNCNSIGKNLFLRVCSHEGVTMLCKNVTQQQFSSDSIDNFMKHPDVPFFAFSVSVPDHGSRNQELRVHLFHVMPDVLPKIESAFQKLTEMKEVARSS